MTDQDPEQKPGPEETPPVADNPPTEEMFALEADLAAGNPVPELDPAVRAALLEGDDPVDSALPPSAPEPAAPATDSPDPVEPAAPVPEAEDTAVIPAVNVDAGPATQQWDAPGQEQPQDEQARLRVAQGRIEVREAIEQARRTGQPWDPPRPPAAGDFEPPAKRRRYWWRFLLATLIVVFSFGTATSASVLGVVNDIADQLSVPKKNQLPNWLVKDSNGGPQTIAIIGTDNRTGGGAAEGDPGRSDTAILMRLDPDSGQIAMLSIPRDLKVEIPGYGTDKFNAAYSYGGPKLTLRTIKQLTGLEINHVIEVDFQGFAMLVDAVGCVFVDVDRQYYNSNEGRAVADMYAEIDIDAGYQKLCGPDALDYARYRHTDSDLVRAARQQMLLGEVRNRLTFREIVKNRNDLIKAFTKNARSDISGGDQILELIRLLFDSRSAHTAQVKFPATFTMDDGVSYVEATQDEIDATVDQFLGFRASKGKVGTLKEGERKTNRGKARQEREVRRRARQAMRKSKIKAPGKESDELADASEPGAELASRLSDSFTVQNLPVFYPRRLPSGTIFTDESRIYGLRDVDKNPHKAYRMVLSLQKNDGLHYFGLQGLRGWQNPPILEAPHETVRMNGRDFQVYSEGGRVRLVAWESRGNVYWVSNSLLLTLSNDQMLGIARSVKAFRPKG